MLRKERWKIEEKKCDGKSFKAANEKKTALKEHWRIQIVIVKKIKTNFMTE